MPVHQLQVLKLCILLICNNLILQNELTVVAENNERRYHNPYTHNDVVQGVSVKSVKKRSAIECGLACKEESSCVSFNYGKNDQTCELHSKRIGEMGKECRDGYRYFELPRDGE